MNIRIYIAAPWIHKARAVEAKLAFESDGFEVTSQWITRETPPGVADRYLAGTTSEEDDDFLMIEADTDVADVRRSDLFVIFNSEKSEGKATELGIAYERQIPIIVVGDVARNVFYHLPELFWVENLDAAIRCAREIVSEAL